VTLASAPARGPGAHLLAQAGCSPPDAQNYNLSLGTSRALAEKPHTPCPSSKLEHRRSQMESPIELVSRFCAAWSDNMGAAELAAFFNEDAVYHNIPLAPVTGREDIANTISSVLRPGPPGIESIDFRVINIAANGPVVMTERVDVFKLPNKSFELPVMGTFEVSGGKINAWRDYFDLNQFASRMG
jgi:limonene-1,2-epoxide hydrolase